MASGVISIWQLFDILLLIGTGGLDVAFVLVNRLILTTGVYKFPYPITTTFLQLLITSLVVLVAPSPVRFVSRIFRSKRLSRSIGPDESELLSSIDNIPVSPDRPSSLTRHANPNRDGIPRLGRRAVKEVAPLAIVYFIKVILENVVFAQTQHPTYLLLRVETIPWTLVLSVFINRVSHSVLTIWSTFLACSTLLLAIYPSVHQITFENVVYGTFSSVFTAVFLVLLLRTSHAFHNSHKLQHRPSDEFDTNVSKKTPSMFNQEGLHTFWFILRLVAITSTLMAIPVLILSGEIQDIHSNSYVLDIKYFWMLVAASGTAAGTLLILTLWAVMVTSPAVTVFLLVPSSVLQVAILNHFNLLLHNWADIVMCWGSSIYFFVIKRKEHVGKALSSKQKFSGVLYHMIFPVILYMGVLYASRLSQARTAIMGISAKNGNATHSSQVIGWHDRTETAFQGKDDYLGLRPHVDMVANLTMMVEQCKRVDGGKGVDDVVNCLSYLTNSEQEYLSLPGSNKNLRASEQDPRQAQFLDADRHGNTRLRYMPTSRAQPASKESIGTCAGPVIPFHVYWTGSASWRVELFIKAYLYTQNLPCSRLWLWLDSDIDPDSVGKMLHRDPIFERFRPLVERGDVVLKAWKFPNRVPIPAENAAENRNTDPSGSEKSISKGIFQDASGQKWLVFDASSTALSPVVVSDAVRFIVLHLYGGLYCDMDVLLLRDMRPMILPDPASGQRAFAEQWVERCHPGDYNTAVISLPANSSLSTYLLSGGLRMGLNFHPRMIGRMLWRDGRNGELAQLHNAVFDPLVTNLRRKGTNTCTVPCHKNFKSAFMRQVEEASNEWSNFHGEHIGPASSGNVREEWANPTNRTLENFFRGSWAYHIHNQWWKFPEPLSWMDVITRAQDGFFTAKRTNVYGEKWNGPEIKGFDWLTK